MQATVVAVAVFVCLAANVGYSFAIGESPPYYTVVGAKTLRPNSAYHASVSLQGPGSASTVRVTIEGVQDGGGLFSTTQTTTVEPYTTRVVKLEIGELGPGEYNLTATSDTSFRKSIALEYVPKSYSVFIQTDKAIYKPGHLIRFRCVVLDRRLRPGVVGSLDVRITDGAGNRVKQWLRALTSKGVFAGELQLSESPVLGDWNITVVVLNQTFSKSIHVAEYVLPKFEVKVETPKHATFSEGKIPITVRARYTYDRKVKGELTVSAFPLIYSGVIQPIFQSPVRHVLPIDGEATLEIDVAAELKLGDEYERAVVIEAVVEEALTGRRQNGSSRVLVHKYPYRLQLFNSAEYYKPGLDYTAQIFVSKHDGSPAKGVVTIRHGFSYDSDNYTAANHTLDANGMVDLVFQTPFKNSSVLGIEAQYLDLKEWFAAIMAAPTEFGAVIQTKLLTKNPKINSDVEIEVETLVPFSHIAYEVLGRGDVLAANVIQYSSAFKTIIKFPVTPSMAPTAHLIAHFATDYGEMVADTLDFDVDGSLQNFVDIDTSVSETSPGNDVELTIRTKPNSYIGLLGIDQSVLALRKGNDLTLNDVEQELRSFDGAPPSPYRNNEGEPVPQTWRPGSGTAQDAFNGAGAVVLTNTEVPEMHPIRASGRPDGRGVTAKPDRGPAVALAGVTRPPLAGPYAFSRIPRPRILWNRPRIFISDILPPEPTWLFFDMSSGIEGKTSLRRSVPDTITSWVITGFAVDPVWGLGLMQRPKKLRVFQPFFVALDLPYSVRRGEVVAIQAVVHNYMSQDVIAEVTLDNIDQSFEFAEVSNDISDTTPKVELYRKKKLTVPRNGGAGISFMVTPKKLGFMNVKVTAMSSIAGDTVIRKLLVKAEGHTQYMNKAIFIDLRQQRNFKTNITLDIPKNIVTGSEFIEISAAGDILGPTIPNLDKLIRMPHGCGEQNMLNLVPNIVVLDYLKNTQQLTPAIQSKAVKYMEIGYQQELTYKRPDGSFSAFGIADESGSVWLTAFVARSLRKASSYISVEEAIIDQALSWLGSKQAANGSFPEVGKVSHQEMQGGAAKGLALTAYTLVAFLEAGNLYRSKYANVIDKATDYVVRNLGQDENVYATAVTAYALQLVSHPAKVGAMNLLESFANTSTEMKWWETKLSNAERNNPWRAMPNSINIEITSYALLAFVQRGLIEDSLPILRWLVSQRNPEGGFTSTQDTVVGLQALAELAQSISQGGRTPQMRIKYEYAPTISSEISINRDNLMVLQKHELPKKTRLLNITAEGNGFAVVQISYRYNINVTGAWPMFTLDPQVDRISTRNHLQLSICSGFVGNRNDSEDSQSNMAVMEVSLPSGYTVDPDALPNLRASPHVKRVETREGDSQVVLYFDHMHRKKEYCPTVSAFRTHKVARQAPVPVQLYDYYDTARRARVFYEPLTTTVCDICVDEDCSDTCSSNVNSQRSDKDGDKKDDAVEALPMLSTLICLLLIPRIF